MIPPAFDGTTILTVRRTFPAARERVFRAWTEAERHCYNGSGQEEWE